MDQPLISIITITFNAAKVLPPTLTSIVDQSFRDFEHIIIDGASTDDTLAVARALSAKSRIVSEPDGGLYDAMNKGLAMARGRYLLFLNAGDSLHASDTLARYAAEAKRGHDIIYGDTVIVDAERHVLGPRHLTAPERLTADSFRRGMLICHQAFMVRRELAPEYDLQYRFSADYDWTIKCIDAADPRKCVNLRTVTIDYLSDGLTDKNHTASLRERYRIMSKRYGTVSTLLRHIGFAARALRRKL